MSFKDWKKEVATNPEAFINHPMVEALLESAYNAGMDRAAEIVENTRSATGHERNLTQVELCAEAIRNLIK
jgi:hypothetical protein